MKSSDPLPSGERRLLRCGFPAVVMFSHPADPPLALGGGGLLLENNRRKRGEQEQERREAAVDDAYGTVCTARGQRWTT